MKIGYQLYEFVSEELRSAVARARENEQKMFKAAKKFAKKYGAHPTKFYIQRVGENGSRIRGFFFEDEPDQALWKCMDRNIYFPKKNTKAARAIHDEFEKIPRWDFKEVVELTGWKDIYDRDGSMLYFFSLWDELDGFCGIKVPIFTKSHYKTHPDTEYKPVKGMRKISFDEYEDRKAEKRISRKKTAPAKRKQLSTLSIRG